MRKIQGDAWSPGWVLSSEREKGFSLDWGMAVSAFCRSTVFHFSAQRQREKRSREVTVSKDRLKGPVGPTYHTQDSCWWW